MEDFDMDAAVDGIGEGLGFGEETGGDDDLELEVDTSTIDVEAKIIPDAPALESNVTPAASEDKPVDAAPAADAAPRTWRKEAAATWAALPSEAKNEILKREQEIFQGIETYKADATYGKSFKSTLAPYEQIMRANNMDPVRTVGGLLNAHHQLATGAPERKVALMRELATSYGIDLNSLVQPVGEAPYVDPAVAGLQSELQQVKSRLQAEDQKRYEAQVQTISTDVAKFQSDPKNVYFNEVSDEIVALINQGKTLQDAYDTAVWMNPATRAKEIARQSAEAAQKLRDATIVKTTAAKKAVAANVTARAKSGSAATPLGSLDDTLNETFAKISSRS